MARVNRKLLLVGLSALPLACAVWTAAASAQSPEAQAPALLPDLDQQPPEDVDLVVERSGRAVRFLLGFRSAVDNVGSGPLVIDGARADRSEPEMTATQVIRRADGTAERREGIGRLRFVTINSHRHWHLLDFMRYELRTPRGRLVTPSRKTGFCIGDRYDLDFFRQLPGEPARPAYTRECGLRRPDLLRVHEGLSVGYADYYDPHLEGQYVPLTGLLAGRYWLVHKSDPGRTLVEEDETNNASAALVDVRWPRGITRAPRVRVVRICPDTTRCKGDTPTEGVR